jgi:hypothetical protein
VGVEFEVERDLGQRMQVSEESREKPATAGASAPARRPVGVLRIAALGVAPLWIVVGPFVWGLSGAGAGTWFWPPLLLAAPTLVSFGAFGWALASLAGSGMARSLAISAGLALAISSLPVLDLARGPLVLEGRVENVSNYQHFERHRASWIEVSPSGGGSAQRVRILGQPREMLRAAHDCAAARGTVRIVHLRGLMKLLSVDCQPRGMPRR